MALTRAPESGLSPLFLVCMPKVLDAGTTIHRKLDENDHRYRTISSLEL